jgi:hypothetical protein
VFPVFFALRNLLPEPLYLQIFFFKSVSLLKTCCWRLIMSFSPQALVWFVPKKITAAPRRGACRPSPAA